MAKETVAVKVSDSINTVLFQFNVKDIHVPKGVRMISDGVFVPREKKPGNKVVNNLQKVSLEQFVIGLERFGFVLVDIHQHNNGSCDGKKIVALRYCVGGESKDGMPDVSSLLKSTFSFVNIHDNPSGVLCVNTGGPFTGTPKHELRYEPGLILDDHNEEEQLAVVSVSAKPKGLVEVGSAIEIAGVVAATE